MTIKEKPTLSKTTKCYFGVRRGGPSSGGGYDRMNFSRVTECGRPAVDGKLLCPRHLLKRAEERWYDEQMKWNRERKEREGN